MQFVKYQAKYLTNILEDLMTVYTYTLGIRAVNSKKPIEFCFTPIPYFVTLPCLSSEVYHPSITHM